MLTGAHSFYYLLKTQSHEYKVDRSSHLSLVLTTFRVQFLFILCLSYSNSVWEHINLHLESDIRLFEQSRIILRFVPRNLFVCLFVSLFNILLCSVTRSSCHLTQSSATSNRFPSYQQFRVTGKSNFWARGLLRVLRIEEVKKIFAFSRVTHLGFIFLYSPKLFQKNMLTVSYPFSLKLMKFRVIHDFLSWLMLTFVKDCFSIFTHYKDNNFNVIFTKAWQHGTKPDPGKGE